jgi:hypothetical protein
MSKQRENLNNMHRTVMRYVESSTNRRPALFRDCVCIEILDGADAIIASEIFSGAIASDIRAWLESEYVALSDLSDWSIRIF